MAAAKFNAGQRRSVLSEINVTPFVDVMLVLLVIFMVTTPILYQGVRVNLPQTTSSKVPVKTQKRITVSVTGSGNIFLEDASYRLSEIGTALSKLMEAEGTTPESGRVFLRADKSVSYGFVVKVIDEIKETGVEKLSLVTESKTIRDKKADM
ncbi:MAG: protein TolR [Candidatus Dadabacteria bacterium]|nr:protein TolR [Candidatus Dadabacteria bacterium]MCY4261955.1 protein TolR [Candidatus Dadabacteria bacterium]